MMQCSDLSAPKAAKGFVKPTVSEIQPKRGKTIAYQPSQKSRAWTADTGEGIAFCVSYFEDEIKIIRLMNCEFLSISAWMCSSLSYAFNS